MRIGFSDMLKRMENAKVNNTPFVIYNLPNSQVLKAYFQQEDTLYYQKSDLESGFIFAPFHKQEKTVLLPAHKCDFYESEIKTPLEIQNSYINVEKGIDKEKTLYVNKVKNAIDWLKQNNYPKIVLSRKEVVPQQDLNLSKVFINLITKYKNACTYIWFHPKVGLWMGATPETLVQVKNNRFETMSLAGTQTYISDKKVIWHPKEVEEQQIVTNYITNKLSEFDLNVGKTENLKAGNLLHLCTRITGKTQSKSQFKNLIKNLHPTPAVCGVPLAATKKYILDNEGYNRSYYTGYLGFVEVKQTGGNQEKLQADLFVNLRCMQICLDKTDKQKANIYIYMGGGITTDSIPEKEFEETVAKSKIMKSVL